ncbi:acyl transferase domain-containing protein [Lophiotrema nucula]|uniref:S-acyl fatty acid synthase thioesterase n=1 Tax=Lophiotrema nucula TaxID=690887 RepID=A0A6A5YL14_9PLEO|nr:acyl transferase domain-containing protein [Lophiotrema nucula]
MADSDLHLSLPSSRDPTATCTPSNSTTPSSPCETLTSSDGVVIAYNGLSYFAKVADEKYNSDILQRRDEYLHLLQGTDQSGRPEPKSQVALVLGFIQYLMDTRSSTSAVLPVLLAFEEKFLQFDDIHNLVLNLPDGVGSALEFLKTYLEAARYCSTPQRSPPSGLLSAAQDGQAKLNLVFGGQSIGNLTCLHDLRTLYTTYAPLLQRLINTASAKLLELSNTTWAHSFYQEKRFDLKKWIEEPGTAPEPTSIACAAISFPLIGLLSFAHYCILCRCLGKMPGEMLELIQGATGHSQGIIAAAAIVQTDDWPSFYAKLEELMTLLFLIGLECHRSSPPSVLPAKELADSIDHGEGRPSNMLVVQGLDRVSLERALARCNSHLAEDAHIYLALFNSQNNYVVAGPAKSLVGLTQYLRSITAGDNIDQSRTPHSKRKPMIKATFLPISAPFHSPYLASAAARIKEKASHLGWTSEAMKIPVLHTKDGKSISTQQDHSLTDILIDAVTSDFVDWPASLRAFDESHIIVLGGGKLGELVLRNKEGEGVAVYMGSELQEGKPNRRIRSKADIFSRNWPQQQLSDLPWSRSFRPRLRRGPTGSLVMDTRFTRLFNVPPVMVAGMTPTTVHPDFVAAIARAGYHVELAGGGYHNPDSMSDSLKQLASMIPAGRGITVNLIYSNPEAMRWQVSLLEKFSRLSFPLEGLVIGAGVPSPDVVAGYVRSLRLRYIGLKPGSTDAIKQVLAIADAHPEFPIVLQWTGGRGGGHHSYEDFHTPIIGLYGELRRRNNIILVAGSGFGDAQGIYPYLNGDWAVKFGCSLMPFDAVLLGSRMMVATEAHTSPQSRKLIVDAKGVEDEHEWEKSYNGPTGGVVTVMSEMRQPIHKLATRGVRFWAEMDKTIFSLPKSQRKDALQAKKTHIISKLNADYAKPWFAVDDSGKPAELQDMTYMLVLERLIELMYVGHQSRWIDRSYAVLVKDFVVRTLERLPHSPTTTGDFSDDPETIFAATLERCPAAKVSKLHLEDVRWLVKRCKARGQKPVNFIPSLDEDFEFFFKKDSLWQSEDVDAVVGQDADRVCILQSPVSVRHSRRVDQSAKHILDEINSELIAKVLKDQYDGNPVSVPLFEKPKQLFSTFEQPSCVDQRYEGSLQVFRPSSYGEIDNDPWFNFIAQNTWGWMRALFSDEYVLQGLTRVANPFRRVLRLRHGENLQLDRIKESITVKGTESGRTICHVCFEDDIVRLRLSGPAHHDTSSLLLDFTYHAIGGDCHFHEDPSTRTKNVAAFYGSLWLDPSDPPSNGLRSVYTSKETVIREDTVRSLSSVLQMALGDPTFGYDLKGAAPQDLSIVLAWPVLIRPLLQVDADLTKLVHLSNRFERCPGVAPIGVGQTVHASAELQALTIEESGKSVEVRATIYRHGTPAAMVTSIFLIRGSFTDFESTFRIEKEPDMLLNIQSPLDEAVLRDRQWLSLHHPSESLQGQRLVFHLSTETTWRDKNVMSRIVTKGAVFSRSELGVEVHVGTVNHESFGPRGNPVTALLRRKGRVLSLSSPLKSSGWHTESTQMVRAPTTNEPYANFSHDTNPIHLCAAFADFAGLPGTITHGMATSAIARAVLQQTAADGVEERFRSFSASFLGMVLPGDVLQVGFAHRSMENGRMVLKVSVRKVDGDELVMEGEAEIDQPTTAYVFTGQGSQSPSMGMELYQSSPAAKKVWDDVDRHLRSLYGWSILDIVRTNPKDLTVHFRGKEGRRIRDNYLAMTIQTTLPGGTIQQKPILAGLSNSSTSYRFSEPRGLLYSTQFAQPAILVLEKAAFAAMQERGLVQQNAVFAGHSLGEYGSLAALAEFMPFRDLASVVFYRGLAMQVNMQRDSMGRTEYAMMAVSPARVGPWFDESLLRKAVRMIAEGSGELLEIVNLNVEGDQYVCAGKLHNLYRLTQVLDQLSRVTMSSLDMAATTVEDSTRQCLAAQVEEAHLDLQRGVATVPLPGVDVPFHSSFLRPGVQSYRAYLQQSIPETGVRAKSLLGKWIPNVMAKPFALDAAYIAEAGRLTNSTVLQGLVEA